ncbi:VOC family protein [Maribacter flavus]|uniref:Glyoxalase/bleomycin resistance/extradiol dioxygenase family protein n=1 Tax=Maribacter flavus TaxID=1658664 RepID=A0A5B2TQT6_9FLAO|nr:glyoxalase/bleomycin resistance/extradiol dioxygenase family protein [Maribacter flavus]KAA2216892.1 glyoxalase/bleomycin resistance/extradiol dioxygenase family protein [Maribacter flavus]
MKQLFINLPVKDIEASMTFYSQMGFINYPLFTFDDQKCMVWGDHIYLMLQTYQMSQKVELKNIADPKTSRIATFTLPVESLEKVNEIVAKCLNAGGKELTEAIDEGFMQIRNIEDLDGHQWAVIYVNIEKFKEVTGRE